LNVWCPSVPEGGIWRYLALRVPASICASCLDAETVDISLDFNRVPVLAGTF
jgi:hypothetical protein